MAGNLEVHGVFLPLWFTGDKMPTILSETMEPGNVTEGDEDVDDDDSDRITDAHSEDEDDSDDDDTDDDADD